MSHYWYCIRTKRYKENWVAQQLLELGQEVYLPLLREQRNVRRKLKWVVEPLFPCYLFSLLFMGRNLDAVRHMAGVVSVVGTPEDGPLVVEEQIINSLRERSLNGYIEVKPSLFFPGEKLQVIAGPFQGLEALFQKELKAGERVAVLLETLSSRVRIEMPCAYVQKNSTIHY